MDVDEYSFCSICDNETNFKVRCCGNFMCHDCSEMWKQSDACRRNKKVTCPFCRRVWFYIKNETQLFFYNIWSKVYKYLCVCTD